MIKIINENELGKYIVCSDAWDFPIEELNYLMEEHNNETFLLYNNRLIEVIPHCFWG